MPSIEQVVQNNVCVGCGGCGTITGGRIPVTINTKGYYEANLTGTTREDLELASRVCPFADESNNEDEIASKALPEMKHDDRVGKYRSFHAARLTSTQELRGSSSGGMTSFLALKLLELGHVEGIIHVGQTENPMFDYVVSHTASEVEARRKSRYHPASFADALQSVRGNGKRYAFVGVPCAVKGARLVASEDPVLGEQLKFFLGLVCGHLKSAAYAESFAWQLGIAPDELSTVDFRVKNPGKLSRQYSFRATSKAGFSAEQQTIDFVGGSWGHAVFQLNACNYCDDIFAETADAVCGDAWLPRYEAEWQGTNVVVSRSEVVDQVLAQARADGEVWSEPLDLEDVVNTQLGNYRHRRTGLAVRLADDDARGRWHPTKRIDVNKVSVSPRRRRLILQRRELSSRSHEMFAEAKEQGQLEVYLNAVKPLIDAYDRVSKPSLFARIRLRGQREFWKLARRFGGSSESRG